MNFMGMGIQEIGVILLVAFLVLGPGRSIDMARNAGKLLGDLRRSFNEVTGALSVEMIDQHTANRDRTQEAPQEPAPGVPVRPETPPEDEDESGGPNSGFNGKR